MNAVCALIFDMNRSKEVDFKFYNICSTSGEKYSTAETLSESLNQQLIKDDIWWYKCVIVGLDNTNANTGTKSLILTEKL